MILSAELIKVILDYHDKASSSSNALVLFNTSNVLKNTLLALGFEKKDDLWVLENSKVNQAINLINLVAQAQKVAPLRSGLLAQALQARNGQS